MERAVLSQHEITSLLLAWGKGDQAALEKLTPLIYDKLYRKAHRYIRRERKGQSLQTADLIHEVYIRLIDGPQVRCEERNHFFRLSAKIMRQILIERARIRRSKKGGGNGIRVFLDDSEFVLQEQSKELIALNEALEMLKAAYPRKAEIVELRYFGGLSNEEIAEVLKVSIRTVTNDWNFAKAWLQREMKRGG